MTLFIKIICRSRFVRSLVAAFNLQEAEVVVIKFIYNFNLFEVLCFSWLLMMDHMVKYLLFSGFHMFFFLSVSLCINYHLISIMRPATSISLTFSSFQI